MSIFAGGAAIFLVIAALAIALFVVALMSVMKAHLDSTERAIWVLIILFAPVLGPIIWFAMKTDRTRFS